MVGLIDCNNFYASCERLFQPKYKGVPVVVLSNNDGCVIARSNEAKEVGIPMGAPYFKYRELIEKHGVAVFSSHYELYGDISARVMNNIARFSPEMEVYSIDECFIGMSGMNDLEDYSERLRSTVIQNTGIPISIGVAPSKVLAKVANKLSKKAKGYMVLDSEDKIENVLSDYPVEDIWGVGRQHAIRLQKIGVKTAMQFRQLPVDWVQKHMSIVGVRLWRELWGQSCLPLKMMSDPKKNLTTSRGFGRTTDSYEELMEATASYTARLAQKLRREKLCCKIIAVRLLTNRFIDQNKQTYPSITIPLPVPVNNSVEMVRHALWGLGKIFLKGYKYQKVEIMALCLIPETEVQFSLFNNYEGSRFNKVSSLMDKLNKHYGAGSVRLGSEGHNPKWNLRREFLSPNYTTSWNDIVKLN
jgi:DNA polymerase V